MRVATATRRTVLLRECWREKAKARKRTLANLSCWSASVIEGLKVLLRGGLPAAQHNANATVAAYKRLAHLKRAFRSMMTVDLNLRPVFVYTEQQVRAHVFLCMLACYVEWQCASA